MPETLMAIKLPLAGTSDKKSKYFTERYYRPSDVIPKGSNTNRQAFLTDTALNKIAETTVKNLEF